MSVKVVIVSGGREVVVETSGNAKIETVAEQALDVWNRVKAPERAVLEAGGIGFQAELAPTTDDEQLRGNR